MSERTFVEMPCSRRGFLSLGGAAALCAGLGAAVAWADDKDKDENKDGLWSTARTDGSTQTVTDMDGDQVTVVQMPSRIADAWGDHTATICALNMGVGLVATAATEEAHPWLYEIVPTIGAATVAPAQGFSAEVLKGTQADVVFADDDDLRDALKDANIPVVDVEFDTFDEMRQSMKLTGQVLGGEAIDRAQAVIDCLDAEIAHVDDTLRNVPTADQQLLEKDRPSVLYGASVYTGVADGAKALSAEWIKAAGGRVANTDDEDEDETYNVNDLIALNPDIIVTETAAEVDQILGDAAWASVSAVQNKRVYVNPRGMNSWAAPGPELCLQVAWLAGKLYPDWTPEEEAVIAAQKFYQQFCNYDLTDEEAQLMMAAQPPIPTQNGLTEAEVQYAEDEDAKEMADSGDIPTNAPVDKDPSGGFPTDTPMM